MFGGFGKSNSGSADKNEALANLIDATNTEEGITALGGVQAKPVPPPSSFSDSSKITTTPSTAPKVDPVLQQIFSQDKDDDYLILPGATKVRPRSQHFTHTVGAAVSVGGFLGSMSGAVKHFSPKLANDRALRPEYLTRVIRAARNNAIRFGTFAVLMSGAAVASENAISMWINRDIDQSYPSDEEVMEMQMKGIQYQPPELREVDPNTQKTVTTFGIYFAGLGLAYPKSRDLWKKAKTVKDLASASKDSGDIEKWFLNRYGSSSKGFADSGKLPKIMRQMAVGRMAGIVIFCTMIDQMWRHQKDTANSLIKNMTSSSNRLF